MFPVGDSWVEAEYPNDNHGSDTSLRVRSDSRTRRSYLKFDLTSIPNGKSLVSVKLYLYCTYVDANPSVEIYVHETGDDWSESTITWNNAPAVGAYITSVSVGGTGKYYCWDITPYGQAQYSGDKILSVVVKLLLDDPSQNNPNYARYFASKEYSGTGQDPYLEVVYEDTPPTALFTYSPTYPVANETVIFDASGSYDPDGSIVSYTWDFGDGNVTTVTSPIIDHEFLTYANYTVTLTVTDDSGLSGLYSQIVEVVDPAILRVYLPEGVYVKQNTGDPWIDEGWLLNRTGNSWSFMLKINNTSKYLKSYDTHLIVALNDAAYNNLQTLTINGTSIPKSAFKNGKPNPYGKGYWPNCVYPTWFNDTYINVGTISPKGTVTLTVSVTFSDATGARMHFDAYGSVANRTPCSWTEVAYSPNSEDSTVLYQAAQPLTVSITPTSAIIDLGQYVTFNSMVSGGTPPYGYQWYLNGSAVNGANQSSWIFTPSATGYYLVHLNVTDNVGSEAKSNVAEVTVNPALSVLIQPISSVIVLGESVNFTSTVSGGTLPYSYQWYLNETAVGGANDPSWNFTPTSTGYYLVCLKVTDGASAVALSNEAEVTVNPKTYTLTIITTTGGTTSPAPGTYTYVEGTNVQVTAIPDVNYNFAYWELDGVYYGTNNPTTVLMDKNHTLKAFFAVVTRTLTITATAGGTTNPAPGNYVYENGTYATVTALPSANYMFDHWVLDGSPAGSINPINVLMDRDHTLHAVFAIINYTLTITTTSGGTTNPSPGTHVYASGTMVEVLAIPDLNYKFVRWELNGNNVTNNPITILMDKNYTLHAVFALLTYRLTILSSTGGTTNPPPGTYTYTNGTYASVTAIPNTHYRFDHWLLDGNPAGSANPISILMTDDHTLQAVFAETHTLRITVSEGGTTDPVPGTYTYDVPTYVTVTAIPYTNYRFDHWVYDDANIGSANPVTVYVGSNHTLHAVFVLITYTLKIETTAGGTTNPSPGTYTYNAGSVVSVTAVPSSGYVFDHWELNGTNVGSANPYSVTMNNNYVLKAFFALAPPPPLSVSISPMSASIILGQSVQFTSSVTGGTTPYKYQWYLNGNPVSGANGTSWIFTPTATGVYYVYLNVTDANNNIAQSGTARIVVSSVPVGGYAISLAKETSPLMFQTIVYTALIVLFGAILSLTKRKRK
ncbi:MAG: PKD domain-containing protein [Candidatus Bathyarchaeia archaeon]